MEARPYDFLLHLQKGYRVGMEPHPCKYVILSEAKDLQTGLLQVTTRCYPLKSSRGGFT